MYMCIYVRTPQSSVCSSTVFTPFSMQCKWNVDLDFPLTPIVTQVNEVIYLGNIGIV